MKFDYVVVCIVLSLASNILAVDLYLSNKTEKAHAATGRSNTRHDEMVSIPPQSHKIFVENITSNDTLTIYQEGQDEPWGKFLISLGGQRNDPIWLTITELKCGQFVLEDILNEPGEGGYSIQILHEDTLPIPKCPRN